MFLCRSVCIVIALSTCLDVPCFVQLKNQLWSRKNRLNGVKMSRESALIKSTFVLSIGVFLPKLTGFITLPLLTAYLTTAEYGTYDLVTILATLLLPAATLQIQTAAFRFLIDTRNDENEVKKIISTIYAFIIPTSGVALLVLFFVLRSISVYSKILLMMSLWTTLSRISTTSRELCRKDVQSRGEPVRRYWRRRK